MRSASVNAGLRGPGASFARRRRIHPRSSFDASIAALVSATRHDRHSRVAPDTQCPRPRGGGADAQQM